MEADRDSEIAKAKRFATEPERIQFARFEALFKGDIDIHTTTYDNGQWHCSCRFFHDWGDCNHTMAMQRVLGVTIPSNYRRTIPGGLGNTGVRGTSTLRIRGIRITQEPLTAQNLTTII